MRLVVVIIPVIVSLVALPNNIAEPTNPGLVLKTGEKGQIDIRDRTDKNGVVLRSAGTEVLSSSPTLVIKR